MGQKDDQQRAGQHTGINDSGKSSASGMQDANASGANQNEQGQASFTTGSATGGGSNYGQGSSHLGGGSYRQGDKTGSGSNYSDQTTHSDIDLSSGTARDDDRLSGDENRGQNTDKEDLPEEGDRRDTGLEQDSGLAQDNSSAAGRQQNGSWRQGSTSTG